MKSRPRRSRTAANSSTTFPRAAALSWSATFCVSSRYCRTKFIDVLEQDETGYKGDCPLPIANCHAHGSFVEGQFLAHTGDARHQALQLLPGRPARRLAQTAVRRERQFLCRRVLKAGTDPS